MRIKLTQQWNSCVFICVCSKPQCTHGVSEFCTTAQLLKCISCVGGDDDQAVVEIQKYFSLAETNKDNVICLCFF